MNLDFRHIVCQGIVLGLGLALLLGAYHLWLKRDKRDTAQWLQELAALFGKFRLEKHGRPVLDNESDNAFWFWPVFSGLVVIGTGCIVFAGHNLVTHHREQILVMLGQGKNGGDGAVLLLGLIAVVMTLVTAGVVTIARHTIEDIRKLRGRIIEKFEEIKEEKQRVLDSMKQLPKQEAELDINLIRLELLSRSQKELEALRLDGQEGTEQYRFRQTLRDHYEKRDNILGYINDLSNRYNRDKHGRLLALEYEYLKGIRELHENYPTDAPKESREIIRMIDSITSR